MSEQANRTRTHRVQVRLNDREYALFRNKVMKSKLTQEAYLRHLINGLVPQEAPPADYYAMMNQLYRVGNNLNQIARKAHALNVIDVQKYDEAYAAYTELVLEITDAVIMPKKML